MKSIVERQRGYFHSFKTRDVSQRKNNLLKLRQLVLDYEDQIHKALKSDLGKPEYEAFVSETGFVISEIDYALKHLNRWAKAKRVWTPLAHFPGSSNIMVEPVGVVLIIGPWNYPFQLAISPLVGAIAAGNCAVIKPSELAPATSAVLKEMINTAFSADFLQVVEGGVDTTTELMENKFDHIFFTGSTRVGKIIMEAAAKQLTPVTLELGGKSPCIVLKDAAVDEAARRISWGKWLNTGQTCVAPDYVLVERSAVSPLLVAIKEQIEKFYGNNPLDSENYGRMINRAHYDRLKEMMTYGNVEIGGVTDDDTLYIAPTVLTDVDLESPLMTEEIFGPLLPIIPVDSFDDAIAFINSRPKPLALYAFTRDKQLQSQILERTTSGGACINDTVVHLASAHLPFGGVGDSGLGHYHGQYSFDTFSNHRSVMVRTLLPDLPLKFPPYENKLKWMKRLHRWIM